MPVRHPEQGLFIYKIANHSKRKRGIWLLLVRCLQVVGNLTNKQTDMIPTPLVYNIAHS